MSTCGGALYGKIFAQIYDGSLYGRWQALVTFQQLIVLADQDGIVDMMPEAISARTSIPFEIIRQGITELEEPDERSRTPDEEGRRIIRLSDARDWGWQITNYAHYRAIRTAEERRQYFRDHKRKQRAKKDTTDTTVNPCPPLSTTSPPSPPIVEVEVEVNAEVENETKERAAVVSFVVRDPVGHALETSLIAQYGPRWEPFAVFLDSRSSRARGAWVREISTTTVSHGLDDVERAMLDLQTTERPISGAKAFRAFVTSAKEERTAALTGRSKAAGGRGAKPKPQVIDYPTADPDAKPKWQL